MGCAASGRLNADGSVDVSFDPAETDYGCFVVLQADGKILVGGPFTMLRGQRRNYIGRLNADGTLDLSFIGGTVPLYRAKNVYQPIVESLEVQADGKIFGQRYISTRSAARLRTLAG